MRLLVTSRNFTVTTNDRKTGRYKEEIGGEKRILRILGDENKTHKKWMRAEKRFRDKITSVHIEMYMLSDTEKKNAIEKCK